MTLIVSATFTGIEAPEVESGQNMSFYVFDFDLNPMTLVLKLDLDMSKMHLYTENKVSSSCRSKVTALTDRQIDKQTRLKLLLATYADGNNSTI